IGKVYFVVPDENKGLPKQKGIKL
ncbi:MAG: hypothetical protein RJA90_1386, partial [Bacteroidota bacterium]